MSRQVLHHNTPEEVRSYIDQAREIADSREVEDVRWSAVFAEASRLLSSKTITVTEAAPALLGGVPIGGITGMGQRG